MKASLAELVGTALLLATVVGSGIMGERLAEGNAALALLANSLATGFALVALIVAFAARSGAHFNPVVTLAFALRAGFPWRQAAPYIVAQLIGAVLGMLVAHAMFDLPLLQTSSNLRTGPGQWWSEAIATFGLVFVVLSCDREPPWSAPLAVGAYIAAAYWFTASTSFANPAVTLARGFTATFSGIEPSGIPAFVLAQLAGAAFALLLDRCTTRPARRAAR
jgi:glycerol uptake facilitator-like aquaporin